MLRVVLAAVSGMERLHSPLREVRPVGVAGCLHAFCKSQFDACTVLASRRASVWKWFRAPIGVALAPEILYVVIKRRGG